MSGPLRTALRWCATSDRTRPRLARLGPVQRAARHVVPGDAIDDALGAAVALQVLDIGTVYTRLDPPIAGAADADAAADAYLELIARIRESELDGEISLDPAALGAALDPDATLARLRSLAATAEANGSFLWLDMGASATVDRTLDLYQRLRASCPRTGVALRADLRRTAKDVERLLPLNPAIRLVKGAGDQGRDVALQSGREIAANYLGIAVTLLREARNRPLRIALGTHDVELVQQIATHASAAGLPRRAVEIHMVHGIRARDQRALARSGYAVRTLIPFGPAWDRWYLEQLAELPRAVRSVLRQLLP
ncbi:MAG: proline dehydrogenase family protein [Chloroflexota bacterium]